MSKNPPERVAYSPREFADLFGKSQSWGYRQIYQGKVKTLTDNGRILIPAAEVDGILEKAGVYDGMKPKPAKTKAEIQLLAPKLQTAWKNFLAARRVAASSTKAAPGSSTPNRKWPLPSAGRKAALQRLTGKVKRQG